MKVSSFLTIAILALLFPVMAFAEGSRRPALDQALLKATEQGDVFRMRRLLDLGANPDFRQRRVYGSPLLLVATLRGHVAAVSLLLERGANPDAKDFRGTPILVAAASTVTDGPESHAVIRAIHVLLRQGKANPNLADSAYIGDDRSALHSAAASGSVPLVRLLLGFGAHADKRNRFGETPLYFAAERGKLDVARLLLSHGADPDTRTRYTRMSPLMIAADCGQAEMVLFLLGQNVDLRARNAFGKTTLDIARAAQARSPASSVGAGTRGRASLSTVVSALKYAAYTQAATPRGG